MDTHDIERVVVAKPLASRPSYSSLNSFSGQLSGTISTSTPTSLSETAITPIRPKTMRIKSAGVIRASVTSLSSQGEVSGTAGCYSSEDPEIKSSVVYKPLAKLVSRKTVHLLANLENLDNAHPYPIPQAQSQVKFADHSDQHLQKQLPSKHHQKHPSKMKSSQTSESSHAASQNIEDNQRAALSMMSGDRPSYDGYNWRKYGQKQVKGSEYPRSYYKCTHPNCPVKKKVERSLDGQIAEIVYKAEHNHSKPQPLKRQPLVLQDQGTTSDMSAQETGNLSWSTSANVRSEGSERRVDNKYEPQLSGTQSYSGKSTNPYDSIMFGSFGAIGTSDYSCGLSGDCEEGSRGFYVDDDGQRIKRRKNEHHANEIGIVGQGAQDAMVQNSPDSEVLGDGFRWRKYGQKVVKGNPYPRSYYRCTNIKCNVRKHVERAVDDPTAFITTYEGKHNHDKPTFGNLNPVASDPDSTANKGKQ